MSKAFYSIVLGVSLIVVGCEQAKAELMTEGAVCHGILLTSMDEEVGTRLDELAKSMPAGAARLPTSDQVYNANVKAVAALNKLVGNKMMTQEQRDKGFESGKALGAKISTFADLKKHFDACDKTINELAKLAGTK